MLRTTVLRKLRRPLPWLALYAALIAVIPVRTVAQTCTGDCNDDMVVSVDELIQGIKINLESGDVSGCRALDRNHDQEVTVDELIARRLLSWRPDRV